VLGGREEIQRLLTIQRGVVTAEARAIKSTKLTLVNRGTVPALTYVRHLPAVGYNELNAQLVTLRKVPQAQELSRNLAKKMAEISDKLQKSTLDAASVEGQRLTHRVALEDRLAELTLETRRDQAIANR
jgi:hypothetical protein